jgi:hypothetical protein
LLHRNHRGPHEIAQGTQIDGTWHEGRTTAKRVVLRGTKVSRRLIV